MEPDNYVAMLLDFEHLLGDKLGRPGNVDMDFDSHLTLRRLRSNLILEESNELLEALDMGTKEDLAKELADLLYVTFGTAIAFGIPIFKVFQRVHDNNMLKLTTSSHVENGKLIKNPKHPKTVLTDLLS
jgi:predicted HAD superfamily Cof-like phosphohydrolase